jgi:glycerol uptake operon antiterminator
MIGNIIESIRKNPVIAAVRKEEDIGEAVLGKAHNIFILNGDIFNITKMVDTVKESGKNVFIHIDFLEGIGRDNRAIDYIAEIIKPCGIISTKSQSIKYAKGKGVFTIQRFFLVDSLSYDTTVKTANMVQPDIVEIMPAVMPGVMGRICRDLSIPAIAGGLIETLEDIELVLSSGPIAVSTGKKALWK